jgi:hypothetical protein
VKFYVDRRVVHKSPAEKKFHEEESSAHRVITGQNQTMDNHGKI